MLDDVGVDHPSGDASVLQMRRHALPADAGALHDDERNLKLKQPSGQRAAVALESAEQPGVFADRAVGLFDQDGDHMPHAVHIDTGDAPARGESPSMTLLQRVECQVAHRSVTGGRCKAPVNWKTPQTGSKAYHPATLLALLIYGYATGTFSSRKIERATDDALAFRYLACNRHPDRDTLATFRKRFGHEFQSTFVQALQVARENPLSRFGTVSLGGHQDQAPGRSPGGDCNSPGQD